MTCRHCGKEIPPDAKFCSYCAEPVVNWEKKTEREAKSAEISDKGGKALILFVVTGLGFGFIWAILEQSVKAGVIAGLIIGGFIGGLVLLLYNLPSKKRKIIEQQYYRDKTSICPVCGCHSVRVYRKGYDWNEAFWGTMFHLKGSRYVAGANSNETICVCEHCHYRWKTGYDYRLIK